MEKSRNTDNKGVNRRNNGGNYAARSYFGNADGLRYFRNW